MKSDSDPNLSAEDAISTIGIPIMPERSEDSYDRAIAEVRAVREQQRQHLPYLSERVEETALRERLADLAHQQWSGWMHYLFGKCEPGREPGSFVIPAWAVERWRRQCSTPYASLPPDEQDSDRKEADKFLRVFKEGGQ